jgi:hypothetical protein
MPVARHFGSRLFWRFSIAVLLTLASFLSISGNYLAIVPPKDFAHPVDISEQLVVDGLLNARPGRTAVLGTFEGPATLQQGDGAVSAGDPDAAKDSGRHFTEYRSQYGLQIKLLNVISRFTGSDISIFHSLASLMMSLVIGAFFFGLSSIFSTSGALAFCLSLLTSPWITLFGRDLYWVEFTWFLPALTVLFLGGAAFTSGAAPVALYLMVTLAFIIKFLCGYEYATTIVIAAALFVLIHAFRRCASLASLVRHVVGIGLASVAAFSVALVIHAHALEGDEVMGLREIADVAQKRTGILGSTADFVQKYCREAYPSQFDECREFYTTSLEVSRVRVTLRYFLMTRFLPWLNTELSQANRDNLREGFNIILTDLPIALSSRTPEEPSQRLEQIPIVTLAVDLANVAAFNLFVAMVFWAAIRQRDQLSLVVAAAFAGSISWFSSARGHSHIHTNLNFVVWYVLFIPFGTLLLSSRCVRKEELEVGRAEASGNVAPP